MDTIYSKTAKGVREAAGKTRTVSRDLRTLLVAIDGKMSVSELLTKTGGRSEEDLRKALGALVADGYIREPVAAAPTPSAATTAAADELADLDFTALPPARGPDPASARREAEERAKRLGEEAANRENEERTKRQAAETATHVAEARAKRLTEEAAKREAEERAKREAAEAASRKAEAQMKRLTEEAAKRESEERAKREAAEAASRKAEAQIKRLADEAAKRESEERARREAAEAASRKAEAQAKRLAEEAAKRESEERAKREAAEAASREAEAQVKRLAEEAARREREERARREAVEVARREAEAQAKRLAEEAAKRESEEREKREAAEAARRAAEAEAKRLAEEAAKRENEERARREAAEAASRAAAAEAKRLAEEAAKRESEERAKREAAEAARRAAEAETKRLAEEAAKRENEERARREAAEAASRAAEAEATRVAAEAVKRESEERAKREAAEAARREAEAEANRLAEKAAKRESEERAKREAAEAASREAEERAQRLAAAREADDRARLADEASRRDAEAARRREDEARAARQVEERARRAAERPEVVQRAAPGRDRKLFKALAAGSLLLAIAGVLLLHVVPFDGRIPRFEAAIAERLQQPVKIESLRFALLPRPHWRLENLAIGDAGQVRAPHLDAFVTTAALFGDQDRFTAIEAAAPTLTAEGLGWLLFRTQRGIEPELARIGATGAKLEIAGIALPPLALVAEIGDEGNWQRIKAASAESKVDLVLERKGEAVELRFAAAAFAVPAADMPALQDFSAGGTVDRDALTVREFEGRAFGGTLSGAAHLKWQGAASLDGDVEAARIDAAQLLPGLFGGGALDGRATFSLPLPEAEKPARAPRLTGSFVIRKGVLATVDLGQVLRDAGAAGRTVFASLEGDVVYDGGRTQLRRLRLDAGALSARGSVDVGAEGAVSGAVAVELSRGSDRHRGDFALAAGPAARRGEGIAWKRR